MAFPSGSRINEVLRYSAEEALSKPLRNLIRSDRDAQTLFEECWETILAGRTWRGQSANLRKDGSQYTEDQVVTPILDASGAITHFIAIKEDITERLQLEAQYRQAQKMESVGQLASGIAHDFNNLLTVINGMSELLLEDISPDNPMHADLQEISEVGKGTSFKIFLPQVTEAGDPDRPAPTVVSTSGTETILLAEDNAGLLKLATRLLEPAGYTVLGAATGEEALHLLEEHRGPVHLLLSDVVMPGMSGRHLAEQLAQTRPGMKVLYMSGYTGDTVVRHGVLEAQMPFLNKPFTAAALLRKVREVLDS